MVGPLLLQDKKVVGDMAGGISSATQLNLAVDIYMPGVGRFILSLTPVQGAVKGQVFLNRISFNLDGKQYEFLTGAPVTRSAEVWVLRDANFKPGGQSQNGFIGSVDLKSLGLFPHDGGAEAKH
jgi:hypothetical protein